MGTLSSAIDALRAKTKEINDMKMKRSTIFLATPPGSNKISVKFDSCTATTMNGGRCQARAKCNGFCQRHAPDLKNMSVL